MIEEEICLLNDSFPPEIDGVSNAVKNYATILNEKKYKVSVVTPSYPNADDSAFDFPIIRYPSLDLRKQIGYTAGNPFDIHTIHELTKRDYSILHSHCPAMSNLIARELRKTKKVPFVMTYHTKFDIDIAKVVHLKPIQEGAIKALVESVSSVDELWVVSKGAGESIKSLGYKGDYIVMENGVDIPRTKATENQIQKATKGYDLPNTVPVFLFVGRMMWYKGIRIILDALAALKGQGLDFRSVFIGTGADEKEIVEYSNELNLGDKVFFTGSIKERETLIAWYSRADLFLFPSTFDTNGLVVREAAACSLGSVLIRNSCAAEGITDRHNALLIDENAASLAVCLSRIMENKEMMKAIGENAANELYLSWDSALDKVVQRYEIVIDNYKAGKYPKHRHLSDEMLNLRTQLIELFD